MTENVFPEALNFRIDYINVVLCAFVCYLKKLNAIIDYDLCYLLPPILLWFDLLLSVCLCALCSQNSVYG